MFLDDVKKLAKKTQPKNGRFHTTTYSRLYVSRKYLLRFLQDKISFVRVGFSPQQKRKSEFYYYNYEIFIKFFDSCKVCS